MLLLLLLLAETWTVSVSNNNPSQLPDEDNERKKIPLINQVCHKLFKWGIIFHQKASFTAKKVQCKHSSNWKQKSKNTRNKQESIKINRGSQGMKRWKEQHIAVKKQTWTLKKGNITCTQRAEGNHAGGGAN